MEFGKGLGGALRESEDGLGGSLEGDICLEMSQWGMEGKKSEEKTKENKKEMKNGGEWDRRG